MGEKFKWIFGGTGHHHITAISGTSVKERPECVHLKLKMVLILITYSIDLCGDLRGLQFRRPGIMAEMGASILHNFNSRYVQLRG